MNKLKLTKIKDYLLDLLYPRHIKCIFCGSELNSNSYNDTCEVCMKTLPFITNSCIRCGAPTNVDNTGVCLNCKANNFDFKQARSVFAYKDDVISVIHKFKYSKMKFLSEPLGKYLCELFATWEINPEIITSIPLYKSKLKNRGYNQSECIARVLSENNNLPYYDLCAKVVDNISQTELDLKQRKENVKNVFQFNKEYKNLIKDKIILIVDDVYTTGSTCNEISKILLSNGAREIFIITIAHGLGQQKM